jgi:hypothetical protein
MKYNPSSREQVVKLKDDRTVYKTHNGFRAFVESKGVSTTITHAYYNKAKRNV